MFTASPRHNCGRRTRTLSITAALIGLCWTSAASASVDPSRDYVLIDTSSLSSGDRASFLSDVDTNVTNLADGKTSWFCASGDTACQSALLSDGIVAVTETVSGEADFDVWITFKNATTNAVLSLQSPSPLIDIADEVDDTAAAGSYSVLVGTLRYARSVTVNGSAVTPSGYDLPKWTDKGDAEDSAVDFMLVEAGYYSGTYNMVTELGPDLEVVMDPDDSCPGCYSLN